MIQGTGSDVGKSVIVAALCRAAKRRGIRVAPFKPQNMSNNAAACKGGGEIGRAQALQALAAGVEPCVDHNPILLKPETDRIAQVVVHGRAFSSMEAARFIESRDALIEPVMESFNRLVADHDLILAEGAGSPAEVNLREPDIANMGFARRAGVPVCLVGDIDRGGVIASIVGTRVILDPEDASMIAGFVVNKFRGDPALFADGVEIIKSQTGWPCFGVIPWLPVTTRLPAEDAVPVVRSSIADESSIRVVAPMLSRMANFDDADPLRLEPSIDFEFVQPGSPLPRDADLVILFGSKSTIGDLRFLREQGWDHDIIAHARSGGRVLGICGGYQMLGVTLSDPGGLDGPAGQVQGLGLLSVETLMSGQKTVRLVSGRCATSGAAVSGYEIHLGETSGPDCVRPMLQIEGRPEGACSADGLVTGTYVHGLMSSDAYRAVFLSLLGRKASDLDYSATVQQALNELADAVENALDTDALLDTAMRPGGR